jgi:hypothetical protein
MFIAKALIMAMVVGVATLIGIALLFLTVISLIGLGKLIIWMFRGDPQPQYPAYMDRKPLPVVSSFWKKPEPILLEDDRLNIPFEGEVIASGSSEGKKDS